MLLRGHHVLVLLVEPIYELSVSRHSGINCLRVGALEVMKYVGYFRTDCHHQTPF